jgi:hypothetical protein
VVEVPLDAVPVGVRPFQVREKSEDLVKARFPFFILKKGGPCLRTGNAVNLEVM